MTVELILENFSIYPRRLACFICTCTLEFLKSQLLRTKLTPHTGFGEFLKVYQEFGVYALRVYPHTATHCNTRNTLQHTATHRNTLQHTATHCNTLQRTATHCNTLQHITTHCSTLQHTATHCNTLQHTATGGRRVRLTHVSAGDALRKPSAGV